uniref:Cytochrome P450 n=1 Tax=Graphocephala atropunctata TaxID=36148 RepID=A0A1B6KCI7_9HEMI
MAFMTGTWSLDVILALSLLLIFLYFYLTPLYRYWKERNVPCLDSSLGFRFNYDLLMRNKAHADIMREIYKIFDKERFCGFYQFRQPILMVRDLQLIERILIKDFSYFEDRGMPLDMKNEPLTMNLSNLRGGQWRALRQKLTPTFTTGKIKGMLNQIYNCGADLVKHIETYARTGEEVDTKTMIFMFSTDVIASCAFGLQIKSDSPEGQRFKEMVNKSIGNSAFTPLRMALKQFYPRLANFLRIKSIPSDASDYFMNITKATLAHRLQNNIKREDFFQLLMTLKEKDDKNNIMEKQDNYLNNTMDSESVKIDTSNEDVQLQYKYNTDPIGGNLRFTEKLLAAQSFAFLAAGSESISTTGSVILHFLAHYPQTQTRLQAEVDSVLSKCGGQWSYQALQEMTYLDQVIQEAQRIFPIAHIHLRNCTVPYQIPDTDVVIEKGTVVMVPSQSIQMDPTYYPNPEVFDPDRFVDKNFKPSPLFSPFGDGPRMCIAMRFAILELKILIARIMEKFSVMPSSKTIIPLRYDPSAFSNRPLGGIWVSFHSRSV